MECCARESWALERGAQEFWALESRARRSWALESRGQERQDNTTREGEGRGGEEEGEQEKQQGGRQGRGRWRGRVPSAARLAPVILAWAVSPVAVGGRMLPS